MTVTIKPLLFVSLLAWFLEATIATNHKPADNRKYLTTATCAYLTNDGNQYNAYTYPEFGNKFCCMCRRGTKLDGDCDPTDATTTKCILCPPGTYQDFEPHDQVECERKNSRYCASPKVYLEESRTEDDGRCVCPTGMIDDARSKNCVPDAFSKSKEIVPKRSSTTTRPTLPTIISTHKTDETSASRLPGNNKGDDPSQSSKPNNSSGKRQTAMVDGSDNDGRIIALSVVLFVLVLAAVIAGAYKLYHKLKRRKPQPAISPSTYISVPVDVEGQQQLPAQEDSIRMRSECRLDCKSDEGRQLIDASDDETRDNRRSQLILAGAANPENSNMVRGNESLCSKVPELTRKPDATPLQQSVTTEGVSQDVKSQRTSNHAGLPTDGRQSTPAESEDHNIDKIELMEKNARRIPPDVHETIAMDVARELEKKLSKKDIRGVFRHILESTCVADENRIDEIMCDRDLTDADRIVKLMRYTLNRKGEDLTPLHLLRTFIKYDFNQYTEVVNAVIHRYLSSQQKRKTQNI